MASQLFLRWALLLATANAAPILLDPLDGKTGEFKLMLFVPGGEVPPEEYLPMIKATQAKSAVRLAVGVARCHINLCDAINEVPGLLKDIVASVNSTQKGALTRAQVFVSGHSLGGVGARHFYDLWPGSAGLALFGTQYNGDHEDYRGPLGYPLDLKAFPGPLLALTGELDMVTFSHTAELVRQWQEMGQDGFQFQKLPLVITGMDHSQFCPAFHVKGDLLPEISDDAATGIISDVVAAWLDAVVSNGSATGAVKTLEDYATKTEPIAAPFVKATALDVEWCAQSQVRLAGVPAEKLKVKAEHRYDSSGLTRCHPDASLSGGVLTASVCDYRFYTNTNKTIPSFLPNYQGPTDISCKMLSEDKVAGELGLPAVDMKSDEVVNKCRSLNEEAFKAAKELVGKDWPRALERFGKQGKKVTFQADSQSLIGPQWVGTGMSWKESDTEVQIASAALITTVKSIVYPGNHYCKLLAPSKAVELLMSAGLTNRYRKARASTELLV